MIDDHERVMEFITEKLKPEQEDKKKFGAVYTPPKLINEMLDRLSDEVWMNPDLKWFDPACGIGNFQVILYETLMKTLSGVIENKEERKRHILENMIYVAELDPKSAHIYKMIFNSKKYKLNVHQGDFLKMSPKRRLIWRSSMSLSAILLINPLETRQSDFGLKPICTKAKLKLRLYF